MDNALAFLDTYGPAAIFAVLFLKESGIPIPVPGDLIVLLAGARAADGRFPLAFILLVIVAATVAGASLQYFLVRGPGRGLFLRAGKYIGITPQRLDRATAALRARGWRAVGIGRMTPGVRIVVVPAAGLARIPYRWAVLAGLMLGNSIFVAVHVLLGYLAGPAVASVLSQLNLPLVPFFLILMALGLAGWLLRRSRRRSAGQAIADWSDAGCPVCTIAGRLVQAVEPEGIAF
jgi:membrane protein DedA with SNARE-associated domain